MAATSLLKIEETFLIRGRGLVLVPDLPVPTQGKFKPFNDTVTVRRSDGSASEFEARFQLEHFYMVEAGDKWSIIVVLANASKADVPVGSELWVSQEVLNKIRGSTVG